MTPGTDEDARNLRRHAIGGVLHTLRTREGWSVEAAAARAGVSHMTLRRVESGLGVRDRSLAAVDGLLGVTPGTTLRALGDDRLVVDLMRRVGVDVPVSEPAAEAVARFAGQMAPSQIRTAMAAPQPAVEPHHREALDACSQHVPVRPTALDHARVLLEALGELDDPELKPLVEAIMAASPRLMYHAALSAARARSDSAAPLSAEHDDDAAEKDLAVGA